MTPGKNPLYGKGHCLCGSGERCSNCSAYIDPAQADELALADVRTLDEWLDGDVGTRQLKFIPTNEDFCVSFMEGLGCPIVGFVRGATPDEARAKAAAWVRGLK